MYIIKQYLKLTKNTYNKILGLFFYLCSVIPITYQIKHIKKRTKEINILINS
jgi:hypothetical protein